MSNKFLNSLEDLDSLNLSDFIKFSRRGIEKENLRSKNCSISLEDHPKAYGSSLTNPRITTDFSEALIELVTSPNKDLNNCLKELENIVYFCLKNTDDDFWPASIPMSIEDESAIPIAEYGHSNSGKLKKLYRIGLSHRYGSMMQTVSGIHYNFSFDDRLFEEWAKNEGGSLREFKDKKYLSLVRNFRRNAWLITYLFGCSPIVPKAFAKGREHSLKELNANDLYLENATCLRMGELGYISKSQDNLNIAYNNLEEYLADLKKALTTDHPRYKTLGTKVGDEYIQLNTAIIQIENEYYSSIRPKRLVGSGERPINALRENGIEYVEIRALDNNIYDPFGISDETAIFLESFLFYCLLCEDQPCDADEIINEKLAKEIKTKIETNDVDFYYVNLVNYIGNKKIINGWMACLAPDGKFCLFRKGKKSWLHGSVHPRYNLNGIKEPFNKCRQELPKAYLHNGCIDILNYSTLSIEEGTISGNNIYPFIIVSYSCE